MEFAVWEHWPRTPLDLVPLLPMRSVVLLLVFLGSLTFPAASQPDVTWRAILDQPAAWYGSAEALQIAANVLAYQGPHGGWPKNIDMAAPLTDDERARLRATADQRHETIDNRATYTQLRFLARVYTATEQPDLRTAFLDGLHYLFEAEYPAGGWPQFFPLRDGYYSHITYNDNAMTGVLRLLHDVAAGQPPFVFIPADERTHAAAAVDRGIAIILKSQIVVDGQRTAWCAQHDPVTLAPRQARSYEPVSLSGSESVGIVRFLMSINPPSPAVAEAIQSAVAWFDRVRLTGMRLERVDAPGTPRGYDRVVAADPDAPPLWARFYEIGTNRPLFCDRDGACHDRLDQISYERRNGYSWLGSYAADLLASDYPVWQQRWAPDRNVLAR